MSIRSVRFAVLFILLITFFSSSCSSDIYIRPFNPNIGHVWKNGVVFTLPKTIIKLTIKYTIYEQDRQRKVEVEPSSIKFETLNLSDPEMSFVIDPCSLDNFFKEVNKFELVMSEEGVLQSVNTEVTDKTAEIISGFISTAISVAKLAAVAGPKKEAKPKVVLREMVVERYLDLSDFNLSNDSLVYSDKPKITQEIQSIIDSFPAYEIPKVELVLHHPHIKAVQYNALLSSSKAFPQNDLTSIGGIPVRIASSILFNIQLKEQIVQTGQTTIAQGGGISLIPLRSGVFTNNNTSLSLSTLGTVNKITYSSSSAGEALSGMLKVSSEDIYKYFEGKEKAAIDRELAILDSKKKLLDKNLDLELFEKEAEKKRIDQELELLKKKKELKDQQGNN